MNYSKCVNSICIIITISLLLSCNSDVKKEKLKGLKEYADFPIGTAIKIKTLSKDTKLQKLQKGNFNSITSASDMKMNSIMPKEGVYSWDIIDSIVGYAQKNKQRLFGHNLIWHSSTPKWVQEKASKDSLWLGTFMKEYITKYVTRYKGKVAAWDVVNEGLESHGGKVRENNLVQCNW